MKKIAAIHDMSCFGRCALTVIIPLLSAMGQQVVPIPTALLSTHTGGFERPYFHDLSDDLVAIGEVGLTGEIRSVSHMNQRLAEAARLGFKKCIIPKGGAEKLDIPQGLTVYRVRNLREAIETAL